MTPRARLVAVLATLTTLILATPLAASGRSDSRISARAHSSHVVGYYIQWGIYGRNYKVKHVETSGSAAKLDDINYAFGNVAPDGRGDVVCQLGDPGPTTRSPGLRTSPSMGAEVTWPRPILGNFQQLQALKAQHPELKVVDLARRLDLVEVLLGRRADAGARGRRSSPSCIDLFIKGNLPDPGWGGMGGPGSAAGVFDGIDLDWEWPGSEGNVGNIIRAEDKRNFTLLRRGVPQAARLRTGTRRPGGTTC